MCYNLKEEEIASVYEQLFRDDNDRIEAQNIYSDCLKFLQEDLHFPFSKSVLMIHKLEEKYDIHFYRQIELTNYLAEIQKFDPSVKEAHSKEYRHYLYQMKIGKPFTKYDGVSRSIIGNILWDKYHVKCGDKNYDKYYSRLYKRLKNGESLNE